MGSEEDKERRRKKRKKNVYAKSLREKQYQPKVVPDKRHKYKRQNKVDIKEIENDE